MTERKKISFKERYETGQTPWEIDRVDSNLVIMLTEAGIKPCKTLDIGCGTGNNSIWLAEQGFEVTGCDASKLAIDKAMEKSNQAGTECAFFEADFLKEKSNTPLYSLLIDRGCFHCFDETSERQQFIDNCFSMLKDGGLWISIIGNADEKRQEQGPPQMSAAEIATLIEPHFEIIIIESGLFDSNLDNAPRAWLCLFRKRS